MIDGLAVIKLGKSMETFQVEKLPDIDQREIKRGFCPWCLTRLAPGGITDGGDMCPECGDSFVGMLTIDD